MNDQLFEQGLKALRELADHLNQPIFLPEFRQARRLVEAGQGYRLISLPKKNGGWREIRSPQPELKAVQQQLLQLFYLRPTHPKLFGWQPGRSPINNARHHLLQHQKMPEWVLRLDLKNAFGSANRQVVRTAVVKTLAFLNSRAGLVNEQIDLVQLAVRASLIDLILLLVMADGQLPQGAPTSPYLLNLVMLDSGAVGVVETWCSRRKGFVWSIYGDDITISSAENKISDFFTNHLINDLESLGWCQINRDKINLNWVRRRSHLITGVVLRSFTKRGQSVNCRLTLSNKTLNRWRGFLHQVRAHFDLPRVEDSWDAGHPLVNQARGIIGWLRQIYGWHPVALPSAVAKEVAAWETIFSPKLLMVEEESSNFYPWPDYDGPEWLEETQDLFPLNPQPWEDDWEWWARYA